MQILDDGRLTDSRGVTVDFRNTIIIMTSNLGSELIYTHAKNEKVLENEMWNVLRSHFKPEFLNRLDRVIIYHPLSKEQVKDISKLQLQRVQARLAENNINLKITDELITFFAEHGYDESFGARPLKRLIDEKLLDELALQIIEGKIVPGDTVTPAVKNDKIEFSLPS